MSGNLESSCALVTGGTGSFGSTMVRELLIRGIGEVRVLSRDEAKQDSLRNELGDSRAKFFLGDVRNPESIKQPMRGADFVFHSAALKQVPSTEFFPLEAVATNVLGSANVIRSAIEERVKSVVCLSTDKAVYPINAMGQTKALMEKTALSFVRNIANLETSISVTRYGNVIASRGSVIPFFISQIRAGQPLRITMPSMTRFMMTLKESVDLVLMAFESRDSGSIYVRKAPAASILNIARAVAELMGKNNYPMETIGARHGEKLFETLVSAEEMVKVEDLGQYFRVPLDSRGLNYASYSDQGGLGEGTPYTSHNTHQMSVEELKKLLGQVEELKHEWR